MTSTIEEIVMYILNCDCLELTVTINIVKLSPIIQHDLTLMICTIECLCTYVHVLYVISYIIAGWSRPKAHWVS